MAPNEQYAVHSRAPVLIQRQRVSCVSLYRSSKQLGTENEFEADSRAEGRKKAKESSSDWEVRRQPL